MYRAAGHERRTPRPIWTKSRRQGEITEGTSAGIRSLCVKKQVNTTPSAALLILASGTWPHFSLALTILLVTWSWPLLLAPAISSRCCCPSKCACTSFSVSDQYRQTLQMVGNLNVSLGGEKKAKRACNYTAPVAASNSSDHFDCTLWPLLPCSICLFL